MKTFCGNAHYDRILHNYFGPTNLFSDLYLAKFLDTSAKLFFPCNKNRVFFKSLKQIGNSNKRILRKSANASLLITSIDNNLLVELGG